MDLVRSPQTFGGNAAAMVGTGGAGDPTDALLMEDGATWFLCEDGTTYLELEA
jgi:hypothetical protein